MVHRRSYSEDVGRLSPMLKMLQEPSPTCPNRRSQTPVRPSQPALSNVITASSTGGSLSRVVAVETRENGRTTGEALYKFSVASNSHLSSEVNLPP